MPGHTISRIPISELKRAPDKVFKRLSHGPLLVIHQKKRVGYIVSPQFMSHIHDCLFDCTLLSKSAQRAAGITQARKITLTDL